MSDCLCIDFFDVGFYLHHLSNTYSIVKLTDEEFMPFGKHKGKSMKDVPATYLLWLHSEILKKDGVNDNDIRIKEYVEDNADVLDKQYFEENT